MGIPMQVREARGLVATCAAGPRVETVDLALTGPLEKGTWVLVFLGSAREVLDPETAAQITRALAGLQSVLGGGDLGDAFADLEAREPQLPPHLRQAS
jgi:hydrogenase expression/formation protein HypC